MGSTSRASAQRFTPVGVCWKQSLGTCWQLGLSSDASRETHAGHRCLWTLLGCFRPDAESAEHLRGWLSGQGWLGANGEPAKPVKDMPELLAVMKLLDPKNFTRMKPRH